MEGRPPPSLAPAARPAGCPRRVLVTNDDGIDAPGLTKLVEALALNRSLQARARLLLSSGA